MMNFNSTMSDFKKIMQQALKSKQQAISLLVAGAAE